MEYIYLPFVKLFGADLNDYLLGLAGDNEANLYNILGTLTVIISVLSPIVYYKIIDRAKWNTWSVCICWLVIMSFASAVTSYVWLESNVQLPCYDENGMELNIDRGDFCWFAFATFIVSALIYFIVSYVWKHFSTNCSKP